jgi:CDP-diacylglycerol--glycerol-3-phosphate 3-phosphatidyltransferase
MPVSPNAQATWANAITTLRLLLSPVMIWLIPDNGAGSWAAIVLWFVLCSSDAIDGRLARRHGTTRSGAFLDPLADKVLVLGAMFALVSVDVFWIVPVAIIAAREVGISVYRTFVGARGISVPASSLGKYKTIVQQFAVAAAIFPPMAQRATWLWHWLLWLAVTLTVISGVQYLWRARAIARQPLPADATAVL